MSEPRTVPCKHGTPLTMSVRLEDGCERCRVELGAMRKMPRYDGLDESTLRCRCGLSITWSSFDHKEFDPWIAKHAVECYPELAAERHGEEKT